jgi:hypothetical protein
MSARFPESGHASCKQCGSTFWQTARRNGAYLKRFCNQACHRAFLRDPVRREERFWSYVDKNGPNGCWIWNGCRDKWGYGDLSWFNKHIQAHRLAWKLLRGDPGKLDCLHKCDNPPCCNPDHIFLGTDADNHWDKCVKGRNPDASLTHDQVRYIRERFKTPYRGLLRDLEKEFGLNGSTILKIKKRLTYRYVE